MHRADELANRPVNTVWNLFELFAPQKRLLQQEQEIARLRRELQAMQTRNESMRDGMRRCISCEYRIDYKRRQDQALDGAP
mgnify:FL=1